jgi:hypothetical protein
LRFCKRFPTPGISFAGSAHNRGAAQRRAGRNGRLPLSLCPAVPSLPSHFFLSLGLQSNGTAQFTCDLTGHSNLLKLYFAVRYSSFAAGD